MAKIVEYEASPAALAYEPKEGGIQAIERAQEQRRAVAWKEAELGHQTGSQIKEGFEKLQTGLTDYEKVAKRHNEAGQLLAAQKASSDESLASQLRNNEQLQKAQPLEQGVGLKQFQSDKAARDARLGTLTPGTPAYKWQLEHNTHEDQAGLTHALAIDNDRSNNALDYVVTNNHDNHLAQIDLNPALGPGFIASADRDVKALLDTIPGGSPEHRQQILLQTVQKKKAEYAYQTIESSAKKDPIATAEQLKPGGTLAPLLTLMPEEKQNEARNRPAYWTERHRAEVNGRDADRERIIKNVDEKIQDTTFKALADPNTNLGELQKQLNDAQAAGIDAAHPENSKGGTPKKMDEMQELVKRRIEAGNTYKMNDRVFQELWTRALQPDGGGLTEHEILSYVYKRDANGNSIGFDIPHADRLLKQAQGNNDEKMTQTELAVRGQIDIWAGVKKDSTGYGFTQPNYSQKAAGLRQYEIEKDHMRQKGYTNQQIVDVTGNPQNPEYKAFWANIYKSVKTAPSFGADDDPGQMDTSPSTLPEAKKPAAAKTAPAAKGTTARDTQVDDIMNRIHGGGTGGAK